MSAEPFRPRLHFSPATGWLNDPNGLIFAGGVWHLFYQHHPHSTVWGPMHWGHASSTDLVTWTELPIALAPDELGTCFSGSAIETADGAIKLFYTAHREAANASEQQTQCLVHADRSLTSFRRDTHNPVVANPGLTAFRDPKVLWHEPTRRWIMLVTHGQSIGFRSSVDLIDWTLESVFGETEGQHSNGPWECPDLVPLPTPDGTTRWVLIVGIGSDAYGGGSGTQYFIGDFDGHRFANRNAPETVLWLDHGRDYYAAQSFFGSTTTIAWASNWQYAGKVPTHDFRGSMALPRELSFVDGPRGPSLRQTIPPAVAERFEFIAAGQTPTTGTYRMHLPLAGSSDLAISLFGADDPHFVVSRTARGLTLRTLRRDTHNLTGFAHDYTVELPASASHLDIFVDNGLVELTAEGLVWLTNLYFPPTPAAPPHVAAMATPGMGA